MISEFKTMFAAHQRSLVAERLFKSVGLDFEAVCKSGDVFALKRAIDARRAAEDTPERRARLAFLTAEIRRLQADNETKRRQLAELTAQHGEISSQLGGMSALRAQAATFHAITADLKAAGFDTTKPLKDQFAAEVARQSRNQLLSAGVQLYDDYVAKPEITGLRRTAAAFKNQPVHDHA